MTVMTGLSVQSSLSTDILGPDTWCTAPLPRPHNYSADIMETFNRATRAASCAS